MQLIQELVDYLRPDKDEGERASLVPPVLDYVYVTLSIHQANHVVSYGPPVRLSAPQFADQPDLLLIGGMLQYFSDRFGTNNQRFSVDLPDEIYVSILQNPLRIELTLITWQDTLMVYEPIHCGANIIFAYSEPLGHLIALTFEKVPNPERKK
jgi:hypothetical protein